MRRGVHCFAGVRQSPRLPGAGGIGAGSAWGPRWLPAMVAGAALGLTVAAYRTGMRGGFYFDDLPNFVEAPVLHWNEWSMGKLTATLRHGPLARRPVANVSFALNYLFGGLQPASYHWTNLVIHLLTGLELIWVVALLLGERPPASAGRDWIRTSACLAGALFLLHPLNVQAVTYVVQRMTSLAALFSLLSCGLYLVARGRFARGKTWWPAAGGSVLAWFLAMGCKEVAVVLPALAIAHDFAGGRSPVREQAGVFWRRHRHWLLPLAAAALFPLAGVAWMLNPHLAVWRWNEPLPLRSFTLWQRLLTEPRVQWFYLGLLVWPAPSRLNLDHPFTVSRSLIDPSTTLVAVLGWIAVAGGAIWLMRRRSRYAFPVIGYLLLHALESGPVNLELTFEHRMYLPMTMVALAVGLALTEVRKHRLPALLSVGACCCFLALATHQRNQVWGEPLAFLRDCAAKSPDKFRPQYNFGTELAVRGEYEQAEQVLLHALVLRPRDSMTHNQLGNLSRIRGRLGDALVHYRAAVEAAPRNAEAIYNLATLYEARGDFRAALRYFHLFLKVTPGRLRAERREVAARAALLARSLSTPHP